VLGSSANNGQPCSPHRPPNSVACLASKRPHHLRKQHFGDKSRMRLCGCPTQGPRVSGAGVHVCFSVEAHGRAQGPRGQRTKMWPGWRKTGSMGQALVSGESRDAVGRCGCYGCWWSVLKYGSAEGRMRGLPRTAGWQLSEHRVEMHLH
jgi:hypothetical protein